MNMQSVVKVAGEVHEVKRNNGKNLEISFFGKKATYWPGKRAVVLRNPVDGKFLSLKTK